MMDQPVVSRQWGVAMDGGCRVGDPFQQMGVGVGRWDAEMV